MKVALPAATDIYLTGGKSHDSEIRLAKFIILNLPAEGHFLDIGAHYGYFALLASKVAGPGGSVYAFEPATDSYALLQENGKTESNITIFKKAVSDTSGTLTFFEFPNLYSEYNSVNVDQFNRETWFSGFKPAQVAVPAITIDILTEGGAFLPSMIKIDVEGAEHKVILGAHNFLSAHAPLVVMEYLKPQRHNEEHRKAAELLRTLGYYSYIILPSGQLAPIEDIDSYLTQNQAESDNIVFKKR